MTTQTTITVTVEAEPQAAPPADALLIRPAFTGGAFLIDQRVTRDLFDAMKVAGASYLSAEMLEEFDLFDAAPGWRYTLAALGVLVERGYALMIRDETITTREALDALFTPEAAAAYRQRILDERDAYRRAEEQARAEEAARCEQLGRAYAAWKAAHLADLVETSARPPRDLAWEHTRYFTKDTPGTWYDTGDRWERAEVDGKAVYRCSYGNASLCYAPQAVVDAWCEAQYRHYLADIYKGREAGAASWVLGGAGNGCYGDDVPTRLVAIHGADHYIARLAGPWVVRSDNASAMQAIERHGIPATILARVAVPDAVLKQLKGRTNAYNIEPVCMVWRAPDGTHDATGYGNTYWPLDEEDSVIVAGYPVDLTIGRGLG